MLLPFLFFLNVQIFLLLVFYEESLTGQHKDGDYVQILGTTCAVGVALEVELVYLWEVPWFIPGFSNPPAKYHLAWLLLGVLKTISTTSPFGQQTTLSLI